MGTSARKHTVPLAGETPTRASLVSGWASVNDVVPVANATARAQLLATLAAPTDGSPAYAPSSSRPLYAMQTDTGEVWQHDGTSWRPWGLRAYCWSARKGGDQTLASGSYDDILSFDLPSDAPAGIYQLVGQVVTFASNTSTQYREMTFAGTALPGGSDGFAAGANINTTLPMILQTVTHTGGAATIKLRARVDATGGGFGARHTALQVTWMGRA